MVVNTAEFLNSSYQKMERTVQLIQHLGFTANEAKAYTGLLRCQPASAYEIAKKTGIPTSKIYETVDRLVTKGIFRHIHPINKKTQEYVALTAEDFLGRIRENTLSQVDELLPLLNKVATRHVDDLIWPLGDSEQLRDKVIETISTAKHALLLSLWPQELDWCIEYLKTAENRSVQVAMVHFGLPEQFVGATYHHPVERTLYEEKGGRGLTLVSDSEQVVIANFRPDGTVDGSWSRNESFVIVAEDYVKHDVYITKVTRFLEREMKSRFGDNYEHLRNVFDADA
jgi:sugar-specific transcriptional regulator TrmB